MCDVLFVTTADNLFAKMWVLLVAAYQARVKETKRVGRGM
jgi:hypothetical protein